MGNRSGTVIRLVSSREWSSEEIRRAFAEDVRVGSSSPDERDDDADRLA